MGQPIRILLVPASDSSLARALVSRRAGHLDDGAFIEGWGDQNSGSQPACGTSRRERTTADWGGAKLIDSKQSGAHAVGMADWVGEDGPHDSVGEAGQCFGTMFL